MGLEILIGVMRLVCNTNGGVRTMAAYYSRVTKKGQATIPAVFRRKFGIEEGDKVVFQEMEEGLILKPAADLEDSAGALSRFADDGAVLARLLQERRKSFR